MSPSGWTIFHRTGATYPTPTRQVNQALAYLVKHADEYDIDPTRIFLAGDSAGAQIAGQMANLVTSPSYAAKVGIVPTVDPSALKAHDPGVRRVRHRVGSNGCPDMTIMRGL